MKNVLRLAVVCVSLLASFSALRAEPVKPTPAPSWKLKDVNGREVSSDQFKGKVVVVDFWATWCGPCRSEIPGYVALQKKYAKDGLVFVGIAYNDRGPDAVKKFIESNHVSYQIVIGDEDVATAFAGSEPIEAIPTTFIIDRDGKIRDRKVGAEETATYEQTILKYLKS
jgi:thiol-disulfide isomerase/thioredoxin